MERRRLRRPGLRRWCVPPSASQCTRSSSYLSAPCLESRPSEHSLQPRRCRGERAARRRGIRTRRRKSTEKSTKVKQLLGPLAAAASDGSSTSLAACACSGPLQTQYRGALEGAPVAEARSSRLVVAHGPATAVLGFAPLAVPRPASTSLDASASLAQDPGSPSIRPYTTLLALLAPLPHTPALSSTSRHGDPRQDCARRQPNLRAPAVQPERLLDLPQLLVRQRARPPRCPTSFRPSG